MKCKAEQHSWPLLAYPKKLKLPTDLYSAANSNEDVNMKQSLSFLNNEQVDLIKARIQRTSKYPKLANPKPDRTEGTSIRQKRKRGSGRTRQKPKRRHSSNEPPSTTERRRSSTRKKSKVAVYTNTSDSDSDSSLSSAESDVSTNSSNVTPK